METFCSLAYFIYLKLIIRDPWVEVVVCVVERGGGGGGLNIGLYNGGLRDSHDIRRLKQPTRELLPAEKVYII